MFDKFYVVALFTFLSTQVAFSQISPGDLAQPHAQLEGISNCTKCHTLGGGPDTQKCLECHEEIKQYFPPFPLKKTGYHFIVTTKQNKTCFECHSDHHGRDFKLIFWRGGKKSFEHAQTTFPLEGKHYFDVKCEDCHQPKNIVHNPRKVNKKVDIAKTFLGLEKACLSCHHDEHQGQLSKDCLQCHTYFGWKPAKKFDHDKANFKLTGKHPNVECAKCHPGVPLQNAKLNKAGKFSFVKFVDIKFDNCTPCHADFHKGKFGQDCQKCHDTSGWDQISSGQFEHSLTRFPLIGLHRQVACEKCHVGRKFTPPPPFEVCTYCHKDVHLGQFADRTDAGRCESCHDVFGFIPARFDIDQHDDTDYPLTGAHLAVPCVACHSEVDKGTPRQRRLFDFSDKSCKACHDDVHRGQFVIKIELGGCESCHQTSSWEETNFDHDSSRFPLVGKHKNVLCSDCHKSVDVGTNLERILFNPMKMACSSCHEDIHLGQFKLGSIPKTCDKCHTPVSWLELIFDHNSDSLFKLRGAHEKVRCDGCHKLFKKEDIEFVLFKPMDKRCKSCHG